MAVPNAAPPTIFIPLNTWDDLSVNGINISVANSVPNAAYLAPANGLDGLEGPADGALVFLAGSTSELDGGQAWLMWVSTSNRVADNINVFNPYVSKTQAGRWISTATLTAGPGLMQSNQVILAGGTSTIAAAQTPIVNVFVQGRSIAGATTLNLPGTTFEGQTINIKDVNGDAGTSNVIVAAADIDGGTSDTIVSNYGARSYVRNPSGWSVR